MIERNSTNVALDNIFEEVFAMIAEAKHVPFSDKIILDEVELANLIDDLKEAIPKEIKSATQVLEEQKNIVNKAFQDAERIVEQAKSEAERIVGVAQAKADAMIQQEEIVQQAVVVAEEIKTNALRYQEETQTAADEYALRIKQDSLQYADGRRDALVALYAVRTVLVRPARLRRRGRRGRSCRALCARHPALLRHEENEFY